MRAYREDAFSYETLEHLQGVIRYVHTSSFERKRRIRQPLDSQLEITAAPALLNDYCDDFSKRSQAAPNTFLKGYKALDRTFS